jgi:hypothetical protein
MGLETLYGTRREPRLKGLTQEGPLQKHVIMNSVLSLGGTAHRYRRKVSAAEIRAGER